MCLFRASGGVTGSDKQRYTTTTQRRPILSLYCKTSYPNSAATWSARWLVKRRFWRSWFVGLISRLGLTGIRVDFQVWRQKSTIEDRLYEIQITIIACFRVFSHAKKDEMEAKLLNWGPEIGTSNRCNLFVCCFSSRLPACDYFDYLVYRCIYLWCRWMFLIEVFAYDVQAFGA